MRKKISRIFLPFLAGLLFLAMGPLFSVAHANPLQGLKATSAQVKSATLKWVNVQNIDVTINGQTTRFTDANGMNHYWDSAGGKDSKTSIYRYTADDCNGGGMSTVWANPYYKAQGQIYFHANINVLQPGTVGSQCVTYKIDPGHVSISDQNNADIFYQFTGNNITRVDGDSGYNFNSNGNYANIFEKTNQSSGACPDIIQYVPSAGNSMGNGILWTLQTNSTGSAAPIPKSVDLHSGACFISPDVSDLANNSNSISADVPNILEIMSNNNKSKTIHIGGTPPANPGISGGTPASPGSTAGSGPAIDTPSCESSGGPLSWITCAVFKGVTELESTIENKVLSFLQVTPINFSTTCNQGDKKGCIFNVWASFRVYGNLFLIIALLIAVLVEAIGGGMVANYTIKKMIPRILVAVILINLSIYVVAIMIDVFNVIGNGVYDLIKQPFQNAGVWHITVGGGTGVLALGLGGAAAGVLGIIAVGDGIGFLLMAIGVPALLAVIGVLITIVVRQGLIVFLTITAPIAFALYCLPNTEQYFKKWWDLLIKTLVVYPVVTLIIAIAGVTSVIFGTLSNDDSWNQVLGIIAGIIPLFLIPFAFKISGGVIAQVSGMTKKGADWANKSLRGNPNDPNSRFNKARDKAQAGRNRQGTSIGMLNARRKGGRVGMAERQRVMGEAYGAKVASSSEVFQANLQNDAVMDCVADRDGFQRRINAATGAEKEQLIAAQSIAETIPKNAAFQAAAVMQKSVTGRSYANVKDISDGYGGTLVGGEAQNRAMVNDAMLGIKDVSVDRQGNYQGTGASAARNRLNAMKANMDASGNSHLGNSGEGEAYNPITATSKKKLEQLAEQPNAVQALAEHAAKQANSGRQAGVEEAAKIRQELSNIANGPGSGIAKEAAAQGVQRIDSTTVSYQAMPNGFIGPGTPLSTPVSFSSYTSTSPVMGQNGVLIAPSGGGAQYAQNGVAQARDFIQKVDQI